MACRKRHFSPYYVMHPNIKGVVEQFNERIFFLRRPNILHHWNLGRHHWNPQRYLQIVHGCELHAHGDTPSGAEHLLMDTRFGWTLARNSTGCSGTRST